LRSHRSRHPQTSTCAGGLRRKTGCRPSNPSSMMCSSDLRFRKTIPIDRPVRRSKRKKLPSSRINARSRDLCNSYTLAVDIASSDFAIRLPAPSVDLESIIYGDLRCGMSRAPCIKQKAVQLLGRSLIMNPTRKLVPNPSLLENPDEDSQERARTPFPL
jgi:hypothetical protein